MEHDLESHSSSSTFTLYFINFFVLSEKAFISEMNNYVLL